MKIVAYYLLTPMSFQTVKALFVFGTEFKIFWMKTGRLVSDCPIDCQVNYSVKAQKSTKTIVKIVHLPSVVKSEFYEVTRILFVKKIIIK